MTGAGQTPDDPLIRQGEEPAATMPNRSSPALLVAALMASLAPTAATAAAADEPHFVTGDFGVAIGSRLADPAALGFAAVPGSPNRNRWQRAADPFWRQIGFTSLDNGIVVDLAAHRFYEGQSLAVALAACRADLARLRAALLQRFPQLQSFTRLERLLYPNGDGHEFVERMMPDGHGAGRRISLACAPPHPGPAAPHPVMLRVGYGIDEAEFDAAEAAPRP